MGNFATTLYNIKGAALRPLRIGSRRILWTPNQGLGFGNFLYLWLHAHLEQAAGRDYRVFETPAMSPWLTAFPLLRERLAISSDSIRFRDRREWRHDTLFQAFGTEYTRTELREFITTFLVPHLEPEVQAPGTVVVNIRRGDYYSVPHFRKAYGFNIAGYLEAALEVAKEAEDIPKATVVSDDPAWCRSNLDAILTEHAGTVEYVPKTAGPLENFRAVSTTRRLIGTNSTFSYWGGYIADVVHSDAQIVMPEFHARWQHDPSAYQLDPNWDIIRALPSGWDEPREDLVVAT
ncbi:hypothetical protein QF038_000794 [Pseudarthrobacter sp. W1I19]|uniref:alpha-1,2-fucosyltransferase n=1 Tax=Pseudarthrobacter sp. W1I19 TaxID=3042288 RepID=UPI00277DD0BE|nr:alpha-1,2-fucosyltransferase [Pseudarthrobacter sp. W1I19]MDQ0922286.1 hypothetical protein [Pseudarthrobacter sp. W1I19]